MSAEERTKLADTRTDLAEDRTLLANERTFAGWARTSFAAIGIALGFNALFKTMQPEWLPKGISTVFLLIAIFVIIAAEQRASSVGNRLTSHQVKTFRAVNLRLITVAIVLGALALMGSIWTLV